MLGSLEVTYDGRPLDLGRPKQRAVLAALLVNANAVVSIDRFADLLWSEGDAPRAPGSLPVYVANLRRLLEPDRPPRTPPQRLLTRPPGYVLRLDPGEYDAATFEALADEGHGHLAEGRVRSARRALGEALCLWRGRALEEFPFAELEAARLEERRVAATGDRLEADLALGAHTAVAGELERLVAEHPMDERFVGLLMLALYRSGRQGEALRAYTRARERLGQELGIEPGPVLRRLEADVLSQASTLDWHPPPPEPEEPPVRHVSHGSAELASDPFVGRTAEVAALDHVLADLVDGSGGIVLVSGEPGIGKTRLARETAARASARRCTVAWGRCHEGDGAPPFWPWIQVIRALLEHTDPSMVRAALAPCAPEVAQIVPEVKDLMGQVASPAPSDPATARFRFFDAVGGFFDRLSRHGPLAVVIDDLHWADGPSLELTTHLADRLPALRSLVVATYRSVDPAPDARLTETLARLARHPRRLQLSLEGLSEEEVAQFIAQEAGAAPDPAVVAAVWARAAGNPFFVGELTRLLVAEKALTETAAKTAGVPWAVRQVIGRRLARLPAETRAVLAVAAVAGQDFDLRAVSVAAGVDLGEAMDLTDLAVAAGVVIEDPAVVGRFAFSHALVHETVYEQVAALRRTRLHLLVADALESLGDGEGTATAVAHHLYEAVPVAGPERAIEAAVRASTSAQAALAYEVAEEHLRRALSLVARMPAGRPRDRQELDVQDHLAALLTLVKGVAVPETAAAWARATELCREVEDRRRLFPSLWGTFSFAWASGDFEGGRAMGEHIAALGAASSEGVLIAAGHLGLGGVALCRGDLAEGRRQLTAGKALADAVPDHLLAEVTHADLRVQVDSWLAMALHLQCEHDAGRALMDQAVARSRALGGTFTVALGLAFAVFSAVLRGDVAEAGQLSDELLDHADIHQLVDFSLHARVARVWARSQAGWPCDEIVTMAEALPPAVEGGIRPWRPFWLALQAEVWLRAGRLDLALADVSRAFGEVDAMGSSFCEAELYRLRGELGAASAPPARGEALADLAQAVRRAEDQGAVVYRERAEASRARISDGGPAPG